jgi:outer membrane protein OmpA-like peptidoglycan-associated protein
MSKPRIRIVPLAAALICGVLLAVPAAGQELRSTLFTEVDGLMAEAQAVRADILAPKSWGKAMERYSSAERKLAEGKNLDDIRKDVAQATVHLGDAIKATELAKVTLAVPLKARDDATRVDAPKSAPQLWQQADAKFAEAGRKLEEGDVNDARKKGGEAESLFREAELSAIKTSFFDETRVLLERAEQDKVERYAPVTLARAHTLLDEAETALNEDRYDTDRPRSLAIEAKYEALHALHLAKLVKMTEDKVMSREELILEAEKPLARVAGALDLKAEFDEGFTRPTEAIIEAIAVSDAEKDQLASDLRDRDQQVAAMTDQVSQLESQLGGASEAQKALQDQMLVQETAQRRFVQVEQQFTREEARVLRDSGQVIVRLIGMNFASGQAVIRPDHFPLLTKVKQAIALYPGARIVIEGHTDAYGTDENNLVLSQQRADAVRQYLLANSPISADEIEAVGYGETRPIANNETKEGREKNRRIDVVIMQGD